MINITQHRGVLYFPSEEDLNGAAVALMRLQDTYKLDTHALANGDLFGKKYSRRLTGRLTQSDIKCIIFITALLFVQLEIAGNLVGSRTTTAITTTRFCGWEKL